MPTLSGIAMLVHQLGSAASIWLSALFIGFDGHYHIIWLSSAALSAIAAVLCYSLKEKNKS